MLEQTRLYDETTGQLRSAMLSQLTGVIHKQTYDNFDHFGNIEQMSTELAGATYTESYSYDDMHRLLQNTRSNGPTINYSYDAIGNLLSKSDFASSYQYAGSKPNAVSQVSLIGGGTKTYGYDNNGNRTKENGTTTAFYNTYNHPTRLIKGSADLRFFYAPNLSRYKQTNGDKATIYIDKYFEKITTNAETKYRYFIDDIAVLTETDTGSDATQEIVFTHRDRLGSTVAMADDLGLSVEIHSFDPFGKPREGYLSDKLEAVLNSDYTTRGYTDHEHLDDVQLIHMNGRVYDYNLGRFLSVDPVIQAPGNSQSMNPYSYIMNNPLAGTDPSGYCGSRIDGVSVSGCKSFDFGGADGANEQRAPTTNAAAAAAQSNGAQTSMTTQSSQMGENSTDTHGVSGGGASSIGGGQDRSNVGSPFTDSASAIENGLQLASNGDDSELSDLLGQSGEDPALLREGDAQKESFASFFGERVMSGQVRDDMFAALDMTLAAGEDAAQFWADIAVNSDHPLASLANIPGGFAALWTRDTAGTTFLTLATAGTAGVGYAKGIEFTFKGGKNFRIAFFGNRTGHATGKFPHYHRHVPGRRPGTTKPGGSIKRHRPWDTKGSDKSFWDRF